MFCPQCGKENADGAQFCVQCGNALKQADTAPLNLSSKRQALLFRRPHLASSPNSPSSLYISSPQYLFSLSPFPLRQQPTP